MTHVFGMLDDSGTFHELIPVPSSIGRDHRAHADASKSKTLKIRWKKVSHSKQEANQDSEHTIFYFLGHIHMLSFWKSQYALQTNTFFKQLQRPVTACSFNVLCGRWARLFRCYAWARSRPAIREKVESKVDPTPACPLDLGRMGSYGQKKPPPLQWNFSSSA